MGTEENKRREWLHKARKDKGFTAQIVADRVGISRSHYSMIENGFSSPSISTAARIAYILEVELTNFVEVDQFTEVLQYEK